MKTGISARLIGGILLVAAAGVAAAAAASQPGNAGAANAGPRVPGGVPGMGTAGPVGQDRSSSGLDRAGSAQDGFPGEAMASARRMADAHFRRVSDLVRANRESLELIDRAPAVRGEIIAMDPSGAVLQAAQGRGYGIMADERVEGLATRYVTLRVPAGKSLKRALAELRQLDSSTIFAANHLHLRSGTIAPEQAPSAAIAPSSPLSGPGIGIIDGGVGQGAALPALVQRGFARGAPAADAHATAVASLVAGGQRVRSSAPGAPLLIADIYGKDPKGGNALALARALGWMASQRVPVVLISLVGPANPIVANAVKQVQARGIHVVAPVGNAGAAAPPMFPASYPGVITVTAVDSRNRALIEAGRGPHLDYAAPGADIVAASLNGRVVKVRGTSFAAPLVAGRLWQARRQGNPISVLDREAIDLGRKGADAVFGRGLVCGECR